MRALAPALPILCISSSLALLNPPRLIRSCIALNRKSPQIAPKSPHLNPKLPFQIAPKSPQELALSSHPSPHRGDGKKQSKRTRAQALLDVASSASHLIPPAAPQIVLPPTPQLIPPQVVLSSTWIPDDLQSVWHRLWFLHLLDTWDSGPQACYAFSLFHLQIMFISGEFLSSSTRPRLAIKEV
jgi:hypothetical protein